MTSDMFKFVLIPANDTEAVQEMEESKSGGLTEDRLIQYARNYFGSQEICDIAALTIPLPTNNYTAVSMYHTSHESKPPNKRAMELIVGCGMNMKICGDVFVGRCIDNEIADIWERVDFVIADVDPASEWCKVARASSGSGSRSTGTSTPSSLSNILQQQINPTSVLQSPTTMTNNFGRNGEFVKEDWGSWSQSDDEVEMKFVVAESTKAKDVKISFGRSKLSIQVNGKEILKGNTFDPVIADECTYTIQTEGNTKELCVTLAKENEGTTWAYTVR